MSRKNRAIRDRRIRTVLWGSLILAFVLVELCIHPFNWKTESHRSPGTQITLEAVSDFLIVVDYSLIEAPADTFLEMSFSLAWLNTFQQEIGPVSLMGSVEFQEADISRYRCIVLTASAAQQDSWVPKIRSFLERGGTVLMEMPGNKLREIASADGKGGVRMAQNLTYAKDMSPEMMQHLSDINLSNMTQIIGSAGPLEDSQTWMNIDGVPVIYTKTYATGKVITLDFNYGMLLTALQQGRPLDDFTIRNVRDSNLIESSDLASNSNVNVPIADILERFLIYGVLSDAMPVVGFWPYFDGMDGAFVVSHRENGNGDAAIWMAQYEATFKATSTVFVSSPLTMTDTGLDAFDNTHADLGLMFELGDSETSRSREPMGMFKISPIWRTLNVEEQLETVKARLDERTPLITSFSRDGIWNSDYTRTFQILSAAGFRADASYRAGLDEPGYAFSTGIPFMPIDTNGLVFNILEFPVSFPEMQTSEQLTVLENFLAESENLHHEVIGVSFDPNQFPAHPKAETFQVWQSAYKLASQHKHWITSILSFFRFSRARFTAELKTRYSEMLMGHKKVTVLRIETLAPEAGMSVTVPKTILERTFTESRRGIQRVRDDAVLADPIAARPLVVDGFDRILIPLSKGFNAIDVMYE